MAGASAENGWGLAWIMAEQWGSRSAKRAGRRWISAEEKLMDSGSIIPVDESYFTRLREESSDKTIAELTQQVENLQKALDSSITDRWKLIQALSESLTILPSLRELPSVKALDRKCAQISADDS